MSDGAQAAPAPASADSSNPAPESNTEVSEDIDALDTAEDVQEPAPKAESKEEKNFKKKYSLKVNNKVKELELDLANDEEVQKYLQKAMASDEKFQEAANVRKGFSELLNQLRTNPLAILTHPDIGLDVKQFAQQILAQEVDEMQKSPEQKRIEQLEKALSEREAREKELEDQKREAEMAKLEEQTYQELDQQITEALSSSELPRSPYVVKRIADTLITAIDMGYKNVTVQQIMPFVEDQITSELNQLFESAPEQSAQKLMEKFVGKKNLDKYRKGRVAQVKAKAPASASSIKDTGSKSSSEGSKEQVQVVSTRKLLGF